MLGGSGPCYSKLSVDKVSNALLSVVHSISDTCITATWLSTLSRRDRVGKSSDHASFLPGIHVDAMKGYPISLSNVRLQPWSFAAQRKPALSSSSRILASHSTRLMTASREAWWTKSGTRTAQLSPSAKSTLNTRHWPPSKCLLRSGTWWSHRSWDIAKGIFSSWKLYCCMISVYIEQLKWCSKASAYVLTQNRVGPSKLGHIQLSVVCWLCH